MSVFMCQEHIGTFVLAPFATTGQMDMACVEATAVNDLHFCYMYQSKLRKYPSNFHAYAADGQGSLLYVLHFFALAHLPMSGLLAAVSGAIGGVHSISQACRAHKSVLVAFSAYVRTDELLRPFYAGSSGGCPPDERVGRRGVPGSGDWSRVLAQAATILSVRVCVS